MSRGPRDFRAEYARRLARGVTKGLSRSEARGHPRVGERSQGHGALKPISDERMQFALKTLRQKQNLARAAREAGVSSERLRRYALEKRTIQKINGRWQIRQSLPRRMLIFSNSRRLEITLGDFDSASLVGRYLHAVREFVETNRRSLLTPFSDLSVADITGKFHRFETQPNVLYRLARSGDHAFEQIYRLVI